MGLIITPTLQNVTEAQGGRNLAGDTRLEVEQDQRLDLFRLLTLLLHHKDQTPVCRHLMFL